MPLAKSILVAVEGAEPSLRDSSMKAARYAIGLASALGSELTAICVVQIPEYIEEETRSKLHDELFAKSAKALEEVGGLARASGVVFRSEVIETSGSISTAICDYGRTRSADMIVLGTRANASSLTKMMLGSVASGVASNADAPVLVVR